MKYMIEKKDRIVEVVLITVMITSIVAVFYSILTVGSTNIHSDIATATLLSRAQLKYHSFFPKTWCYANGDVWVIGSNLFTMPFSFLLKDQVIARMLGSVLIVFVVCVSIILFTHIFLNSKSWLISVPIFLLCCVKSYEYVLYQAAYTATIMWMILSIWFVYSMIYEQKKIFYLPYFATTFLLVLGGIRFVAETTMPLICTLGLIEYFSIQGNGRNLYRRIIAVVFKFIIIIIPVVIGLCGYKLICASHIVVNTEILFSKDIGHCLDSLWSGIKVLCDNFGINENARLISSWGLRNLVSICMVTILVFIIPILQIMKYRDESPKVRFFLLFSVLHNIEMLILFAFFDKNSARYLLSSVFLIELISSRYIYDYWFKKINIKYFPVIVGYIMAISVYIFVLVFSNRWWASKLVENREFCHEIEKKGIEKGYATYWNAYGNEIYSNLSLRFGAIELSAKKIKPYYWLVDANIFKPEDSIKSFLLLDEMENRKYKKSLEMLLGEYNNRYIIKNGEAMYYLYIYDYDIALKFSE